MKEKAIVKKEKCVRCQKVFVGLEALDEHSRLAHPPLIEDHALERAAKSAMYDYLTSDGSDKNLRERSKHASNYISGEARREAARNNFLSVMIAVAARVTADKAEFTKVLGKAMPELPIIKALAN